MNLGDHCCLHPELSPPAAPARLVLAVVDVQRRGGIESVADVERVDVDDAEPVAVLAALVGHDRADIGAALGAQRIVGDAEPEAIARQAAGLGAELDRTCQIARGAGTMAAAERAGAAADAHRLGRLVRGEGDLHNAAVAGARISGHGAINVALKSLTLVRVGPVTIWSPRAANKLWASLSASMARGSRPRARARASVSGRDDARRRLSSAPSMPSVSPASAQMPGAPSSATARPSRIFDVAPAAPVAAHRDRGLAAGEQDARAPRRWPVRDTDARCRPCTLPTSRASPSSASPSITGVTPALAGHRGRGLERRAAGVAISRWSRRRRGADRRAWASRAAGPLPDGRARRRQARCRSGRAPPRVGEGGRVGHGRAAGDHAGIVAGHVGDQQLSDARRLGAAAASRPPLIAREVLAHAVHLVDAAPERSSAG